MPRNPAPVGHEKAASKARPLKASLYPNYQGDVVRAIPGEADDFDLLREQLVLGYCYQTARAYWTDLEQWRDWCLEQNPEVDALAVEPHAVKRYLDALHVAGYADTTRARRRSILRRFSALSGSDFNSTARIKRDG
jgi:hypothetical protein